MKFSLVLATISRTQEVSRLLQSLYDQTYKDFELIIVDQNSDNRLLSVFEPYRNNLHIIHLRSTPGLSHARNVGLRYITGEIVSFPDDDCWYPKDLLERVEGILREHSELGGLAGACVDEVGMPSVGRWDRNAGPITRFNIWRRAVSASVFLRRAAVEKVGLFDETLGAGADTGWGSGEETDYLLRILKEGFNLHYDPKLFVYHPTPIRAYNMQTMLRAYTYGRGLGRVLRKHNYPFWFVIYQWVRPLGGMALAIMRGKVDKAQYYAAVFRGRLSGWLATL